MSRHAHQWRGLFTVAFAAAAFATTTLHAVPVVGTFTGGDGADGLDLDGKIVYAVHAQTAGSHQVRDALFLDRNQPGVFIGGNAETAFGSPTYGGATPTTNDSNLRLAMDFVKFDGVDLNVPSNVGTVPISLANLTVGETYKVQLMFNEACCVRGMNVTLPNGATVNNFVPGTVQGGNNQGVGAVITETFVATSTTANITLVGALGFPDRNPMIDALTVEQLPTNVSIGTFTGGDAGEGLDLQGKFAYAVHAATGGVHQVGDATFTPRTTPGVFFGGNSETPFGAPTYGDPVPTANDLALRQVMDFVKFDSVDLNDPNAIGTLPINLDVVAGQKYKLQLMFNEACCNRIMDVFVEGLQVADEFNPGILQGGNNQGIGAVITYEFIATDSVLNLVLRGDLDLGGPGVDRNPMIDALTLETILIPEPATAMLGMLGLAALASRRRRAA